MVVVLVLGAAYGFRAPLLRMAAWPLVVDEPAPDGEYVFPGGELTHLSRVIGEMSARGLECRDAECLRPHYARTLWHWVERLESRRAAALAMVGEKRYRVWRIYMAGSAHAFERGWLSVYQVLAGRPAANGILPLPPTREYIYSP